MLNRHFSPYSTFICAQTRTVFVLNPKVMTQFTRRLLRRGLRKFRGLQDPSDGRWPMLKAARQFPIAPAGVLLEAALRPGRFEAFALVRHPHGRLLSAWRNKFLDGHAQAGGRGDAGYPPSMRARALPALRRFARGAGLPGGAPGEAVPFDTFVRHVAAGREGRRDAHWDVQHAVIQAGHFRFARVFRVEDARDEAFLTVFGRVGFAPRWIRGRLDEPVNRSVGPEVGGYDAETAALVTRAFARDFEAFGYDPGDWRRWAAPEAGGGGAAG